MKKNYKPPKINKQKKAMEDSSSTSKDHINKRPKRKSRPRRANPLATTDSIIDIVEARREIALALRHHRSSSSSSSSSPSCAASDQIVPENENPTVGTTTTTASTASPLLGNNVYSCYSLMESMPVPEPTWSTTAPSVMVDPLDYLGNISNQVEASYYSWWLGFWKRLDSNDTNTNTHDYSNYSDQCFSKLLLSMDQEYRVSNDEISPCCGNTPPVIVPDQWLSFSTAQDEITDINDINSISYNDKL